MGCQEDAECLAGSRVTWRRPSRKEIAEQLVGQQVARGAECPGGHREPRGHLRGRGRQATRRAQGDQKVQNSE